MRILHISSAQTLGGGERHLVDLVGALVARGHEVYVVVRPNSPLIDELTALPRENIARLPLRNALDALSARKLARFVREHQIEIVHAHMARDYPLASYATRKNRETGLIITRHVLFRLSRLHAIALSHVARVIAVSEAVRRSLRDQHLVADERIVVVPNGIDVQRFDHARSQFDRKEFCRQWDLEEDGLLVGTVGELKALKGHDDFVRAAAIIARRVPHAEFLIAGLDTSHKGEYRVKLEGLIEELGLAKRVRVVGWLADLASLYCALEVFVSASRTESFGLAIAEAMASGTPVVATATEGAREIVENDKTGMVVGVGDVDGLAAAIIAALEDPAKRRRLAASARESVHERFGLEAMIDATERIYRELVN